MASRHAWSEYYIIMVHIGTYTTYVYNMAVQCINILFVLFSRTESDLLKN